MTSAPDATDDLDGIREGLETDGIIACRGVLSTDWVARLREDIDAAFEEARSREGGPTLDRIAMGTSTPP